MAVLLDTDHVSILQHKARPAYDVLETRLRLLPTDAICVSIISYQEQTRGWLAYIHRAKKPQQVLKGFADLHDVLEFYASQTVRPFDLQAMNEFLALQQQRIRIGTNDLRIAAIAMANGVKLVSRNLRDFRLVPGLDVEDWTV